MIDGRNIKTFSVDDLEHPRVYVVDWAKLYQPSPLDRLWVVTYDGYQPSPTVRRHEAPSAVAAIQKTFSCMHEVHRPTFVTADTGSEGETLYRFGFRVHWIRVRRVALEELVDGRAFELVHVRVITASRVLHTHQWDGLDGGGRG